MEEKLIVASAIAAALDNALTTEQIEKLLERPKQADHGDWAFPTFALAKTLRKAPQAIASELAPTINAEAFDKIEAVGPYLNFFLNKSQVSAKVLADIIAAGSDFGNNESGHGATITIDMSSPNIAKPISMGHLRSTVIGNALANISKKVGYAPYKINHLGDWGTQFGKLITAYKKWGSEEAVKANPITELLRLYVDFHEKAAVDDSLNDEARAWFKRLEDNDPEALELWKWFRAESLKEFAKIYDMLEVTFDSYNGEAFYNDKMDAVVDLLDQKGLLKESRGAEIVDLSKYDLIPALIKKSDGATLYITRDLAAAIYRKETYHFAKSLYLVGLEQTVHFKQLKAVLTEMGFDWAKDIYHVPFGLITKDGKKLSTRKGKIVLLEEVLNDAVALAKAQIVAKNPDLPNQDEVAHQVGVGAVIFHDLKNDRLNNFDFNLEEVVRFEGETGPYVQYAHARINSILRKADFTPSNSATYSLTDDNAWEIIKLLQSYPATVARAAENFEPSIIAKHAILLAQAFNKYYGNVKILTEDEQKPARLAMAYAVKTILAEDLRLLGLHAPEEM